MNLSEKIKNRIKKEALDDINQRNLINEINLYVQTEKIPSQEKLSFGLKDVSLSQNTALVFADLAPRYNWGHPCQHRLYNAETGDLYEVRDADFPPMEYFTNFETFEPVHEPVKQIDSVQMKAGRFLGSTVPAINEALSCAPGNRYAILFSGLSNNRHTNDLEFMYRTLIDIYGFEAEKIYVLNHNGTVDYFGDPHPVVKWPGDNTPYRMIVNGPGTKSAFDNVLGKIAAKIGRYDFLFIHTNNHGGHNGESCICCYPESGGSWIPYYSSEFAAKLKNTLPTFASLMVVMEQCHSGGFLNPIIKSSPAITTHVAAACEELRSSIGGANFDPFAFDWIAGVTGKHPDGSALKQIVDADYDGAVSAAEAFVYANAVHDAYDTPVVDDYPAGCGTRMFLGFPNLLVSNNLYIKRSNFAAIHYGNKGLLGQAASFNPDRGNSGLWIEGSTDGSECGGIFANGNTLCLWSPGDNDILRVYDEDSFYLPNPLPKFEIAGNGNVGIGVPVPASMLHVLGRITAGRNFDGFSGGITFLPGDGYAWFHIDNGPAGARPLGRLRISYGANPGEQEVISILQNGTVGIRTSAPRGTLDVNGTIVQRGTMLHADHVLNQGYDLESIDEHTEFMLKEKRLKAIPLSTKDEGGNDILEYGSYIKGIIEELEKAHLYIARLSKSIEEQKKVISKLSGI